MRIRAAVELCLATVLLFAIATPAAAQNKAPSGILLGAGVSFLIDEETATGFSVNVNKDFHSEGKIAIGVAGDVGFHKFSQSIENLVDASATISSFLVGPRITSTANQTFSPFGQFMIGVGRFGISAELAGQEVIDASASGFGFSVGGGLNVKATNKLNFLVQVDYLHFSLEVEGENLSGGATRLLVGVSTRIGG